jgi:hypothetical protein
MSMSALLKKSCAAGKFLLLTGSILAGPAIPAFAGPISFTGNTTGTLTSAVSSAVSFTGTSFNVTADAATSATFGIGTLTVKDLTKAGFSAVNDGLTISLNLTGGPFAGTTVPLTFDLWGRWNGFFGNVDI